MDADEIKKYMKPSQPKAAHNNVAAQIAEIIKNSVEDINPSEMIAILAQLIGRVQFVSVGPGTPDDRLIIKTMVEMSIASGLNDAMAKAIELGYEPPEVL